jgi:hypothetical protein
VGKEEVNIVVEMDKEDKEGKEDKEDKDKVVE